MVVPISLMAATEFIAWRACMPAICVPISPVALAVCAGERLDLRGDHRKAAAGVAGAGGLDRGVQRQQDWSDSAIAVISFDDVADAAKVRPGPVRRSAFVGLARA